MKDRIFESKENYLETILVLAKRNGSVRSVDIAAEMKNLREDGCIEVDKNGYITLTETGMEIAERVYERHVLFTGWLTGMGVPAEIAAEDACRIEHVISAESFEAIKNFVTKHGGAL